MLSSDDNYVLINYHYIKDPSSMEKGIHPCSILEFKRQVDFICSNYEVVTIPRIFNLAKNKEKGKFCSITFDDGLKDQFENAIPVISKHNISATFFPITSTLSGRMPATHKIHVLLSTVTVEEVVDMFHGFIEKFYPDMKSLYLVPKDKRLYERRKHEDILTANLKEVMISLNDDIKNRFLRYCFKKFNLNEDLLSRNMFMSEKQLKELKSTGMSIGSHSHGHYSMDSVSSGFMEKDIELSCKILKDLLGDFSNIYSYSHGHNNKEGVDVLKKIGFDFAVTTEARNLSSDDNNFLIPRYDANDLRSFAI